MYVCIYIFYIYIYTYIRGVGQTNLVFGNNVPTYNLSITLNKLN